MKHPLTDYRERNGLTQEAFADRVGVTRWMINRIETGDRNPSMDLMRRIADETSGEVTPNDFLPRVQAPALAPGAEAESEAVR